MSFSQIFGLYIPCFSSFPGNARLSWCQAPITLCG
jgi:hypothetical protein